MNPVPFIVYGVEADLTSISAADSVPLRAAKNAILAALRRFTRN